MDKKPKEFFEKDVEGLGSNYPRIATCYSNSASVWFTAQGKCIYVN